MKHSDAKKLFDQMYPDFFDRPFIRAIAQGRVFEEMILELGGEIPAPPSAAPDGITFGLFCGGDEAALRESVAQVDESWVQYFGKTGEVYCAFDGGKVVSFCLLDDMGVHELAGRRVKVAGPGCVGTVPAYRRRGIGLEMVRRATQILKDRGYDVSYIHYTGVGPWYAGLGYETILKWDRNGVIAPGE